MKMIKNIKVISTVILSLLILSLNCQQNKTDKNIASKSISKSISSDQQISKPVAAPHTKTLIYTIEPFKVEGMTVVSPLKDGQLAAYASDFIATAKIKIPNSGAISFKAIELYNTDLSVSINGQKVWEPDIKGFKDYEESPSITIPPDSTKSDSVKVRLAVSGLNGGLQLFQIYSE